MIGGSWKGRNVVSDSGGVANAAAGLLRRRCTLQARGPGGGIGKPVSSGEDCAFVHLACLRLSILSLQRPRSACAMNPFSQPWRSLRIVGSSDSVFLLAAWDNP